MPAVLNKKHAAAICHAADTEAIAGRLRTALSRRTLSCWAPIEAAPRGSCLVSDIEGIEASWLPIFLVSTEAAADQAFVRAVGYAVAHSRWIVSLRVDHAPMPRTLEYYVGDHHSFDTRNMALDHAVEIVADEVALLVDGITRLPAGARG